MEQVSHCNNELQPQEEVQRVLSASDLDYVSQDKYLLHSSQLSPRCVMDDDDSLSEDDVTAAAATANQVEEGEDNLCNNVGLDAKLREKAASVPAAAMGSEEDGEEILAEFIEEEGDFMQDDESCSASSLPSEFQPCASSTSHHLHDAQYARAEDTVILLDYDDTILASSWLAARDLGLSTPDHVVREHAEELRVLEACAAKLLSKTIELGDVHLVTNAEEGWIELTVAKFMPALRPLLPHVTIISARSTFEREHPSCPRTWKVMAFRRQLCMSIRGRFSSPLHSGRKLNVISMGDSQHEREALHIVAAELTGVITKSVKFVERPSLDVLRRQMELVHSCFDYICGYDGDLDLMLSQIIGEYETCYVR